MHSELQHVWNQCHRSKDLQRDCIMRLYWSPFGVHGLALEGFKIKGYYLLEKHVAANMRLLWAWSAQMKAAEKVVVGNWRGL